MAKRAKGTGTLRKRTDGRWEGRIYLGKDENGKNKYKTVTSLKKTECQKKLDKLIEEKEKSVNIQACRYTDCQNPTLEEWNSIWIENYCKGYLKSKTVSLSLTFSLITALILSITLLSVGILNWSIKLSITETLTF